MHGTTTTLTRYNAQELVQQNYPDLNQLSLKPDNFIEWVSVIGLSHPIIQNLRDQLGFHPLIAEDILDENQRPKLREYDGYLFITTKNIFYDLNDQIITEQISFLLYKDRLISFQEQESDLFTEVYARLSEGGNIRKNGADDLLYLLLDAIVDNFFVTIEEFGRKTDLVEDLLLADPGRELLEEIYKLKRELIFIRNLIWPMRNVVSNLSKNEFELVDGKTVHYLRDTHDHIVQVMDIVETYRDICSGMLDTYLSSIGNKTNEVMKVLTIFSTIFIPLTFLAGVYGMNFIFLPELKWKYGYLAFWIISAVTTGFMIRFFKKKGWL